MNWSFLDSGKSNAAFNMALDEALLEQAAELGQPVLRFYGWTEPAASFGYFQRYAEVAQTTQLRPLVRRPTGGGIVPHDIDWTYSFVVPPDHEWHLLKAEESYRRIHAWIQSAFGRLNIATELAPCCKKSLPGQCFVGHEKFDLLWQGKKIAGAAQRRNKAGLLIQGSVQPPPIKISHDDWKTAMRDFAREQWNVTWKERLPEEKLLAICTDLAQKKYSQAVYNQKR